MQLSVLLPARNAEATVELAVRSTLADLSGIDAELICVDDGSTDGTRAKLEALAKMDPRIRIVDGPARGIAAALNCGLAACRGALVARMDADDEWLAGRAAAQMAALEDPELVAVGGAVELFGEVGAGMQQYARWLNTLRSPEEIRRARFIESPLVHPASMIRRSALGLLGGWRDGPFPEDYALWLDLLVRRFALANVPNVVLRWRDSGARLTRTDPRYSLDAHAQLKADFLMREPFSRGPLRIAGAGPTGLRLLRALVARGAEVRQLIEVHPRKIGTRIDGIPVIAYDELGPPSEGHVVVAVGIPEARDEVREFLRARGWVELRDFTCCA